MHARMKESLPDPKPKDRTEEIFNILSKMQNAQAAAPTAPAVAAYGPPSANIDHVPRASKDNQSVSKDEIIQIIRQELRRPNQNRGFNSIQRGRRTHDGKVICDWCSKPGHVMAVCRQRLSQRRDPRIPFTPRPYQNSQPWGQRPGQRSYPERSTFSRPLN